jgi:hypothetical protein
MLTGATTRLDLRMTAMTVWDGRSVPWRIGDWGDSQLEGDEGENQLGRGLDKICMAGVFIQRVTFLEIARVQAHLTTIGIPRDTESCFRASSRPLPIFVCECQGMS